MTDVSKDQFKWAGERLTHEPTGASFHKRSEFVNFGNAGNTLPDGSCYEREDVLRIAHEMVVQSKRDETPE
ncbi:MAG: hypothetical protein AAGK70_09905 [Pseudomonadota bacterium]